MPKISKPKKTYLFPKRAFNVEEAAMYCSVSKTYLEHRRLYGGGPRYFRTGRSVHYLVEDLDAWLDTFETFEHTSEEPDLVRPAANG